MINMRSSQKVRTKRINQLHFDVNPMLLHLSRKYNRVRETTTRLFFKPTPWIFKSNPSKVTVIFVFFLSFNKIDKAHENECWREVACSSGGSRPIQLSRSNYWFQLFLSFRASNAWENWNSWHARGQKGNRLFFLQFNAESIIPVYFSSVFKPLEKRLLRRRKTSIKPRVEK